MENVLAVVFTVRNSRKVLSVTRAKGRDDNSRLSGFVTRHGRHVIRRRDDTTRNRLRRVRSISYDHDRGHRARPARARFPETPRWAGGGRTPPRAPPSRRRSAEMETRATAWCVPPGAGRPKCFAEPNPFDSLLAHASHSGLPTRAPHVRDRDPTRPHTHARRPHHPETCGFRGSPVRVARLLRPRTRGEREGFAARGRT